MAGTEPFFVPLGDEVLIEAPASLKFTDEFARVLEDLARPCGVMFGSRTIG